MKEVLDCPFCGSEAMVKHTQVYYSKAIKIVCTRCHIGTIPVQEGEYISYQGEKNKVFTIEEAKEEVIKKWNNRVAVAVS